MSIGAAAAVRSRGRSRVARNSYWPWVCFRGPTSAPFASCTGRTRRASAASRCTGTTPGASLVSGRITSIPSASAGPCTRRTRWWRTPPRTCRISCACSTRPVCAGSVNTLRRKRNSPLIVRRRLLRNISSTVPSLPYAHRRPTLSRVFSIPPTVQRTNVHCRYLEEILSPPRSIRILDFVRRVTRWMTTDLRSKKKKRRGGGGGTPSICRPLNRSVRYSRSNYASTPSNNRGNYWRSNISELKESKARWS